MIDSHSHIYCEDFDSDRDLVIARAQEAGVRHIVLPNENLESIERVLSLKNAYPSYISIALGLHPEDVDDDYERQLTAMRPLLDEHRPVAVGEIGIDLYWDATWREQ
jgi:TatD DNase family protein